MNKKSVMLIRVFALILVIFLAIVAYDFYIDEQTGFRNPLLFSRYLNTGYYKIDSETILTSLNGEKTFVFSPLLGDPRLLEPLTDISFSWTQSDFLNIASTLGQLVWEDPMDLRDWQVYDLSFAKDCEGDLDLSGYQFGSIVYFKDEKGMYTTRIIEIYPPFNWVRWGGGETYPKPILNKWESINLIDAKITAEDALRIAEENGGRDARLRDENMCYILVNSYTDNKWDVNYGSSFHVYIDLYTGEYEILNTNQ